MMKQDELKATTIEETKKILIKHNTTEEVEPETIIKIVEDIKQKIADDQKTIEETNKNLDTMNERLEELQLVLPMAKLWASLKEKKEERKAK